MFLDVAVVAVLLIAGNVVFHHFDPRLALWRSVLKTAVALAITGIVSHYFGRTGVAIAVGLALLPLIYVHGIWLPSRGVNGWTGEPREKYYALRGWPPSGPP